MESLADHLVALFDVRYRILRRDRNLPGDDFRRQGSMGFIFYLAFALFPLFILCLSLALLASASYLKSGGGNLNPFRL